jgi:hypothetical protein
LDGTSGGLARFHHSPVDRWSRLGNFSPNNSFDSGSAFIADNRVERQKIDNMSIFIAKKESNSSFLSRLK